MHFLTARIQKRDLVPFTVGPHAFVRVRVDAQQSVLLIDVDPARPVIVTGADVSWVELPAEFRVLDPEGKRMKASGAFCVTTETFDPYHGVCDVARDRRPRRAG